MNHLIKLVLLALVLLSTNAFSQKFEFGTNVKYTAITFESSMDLEDILGTSRDLKGFVNIKGDSDADFYLEVPVDSLKTGIDLRDEHLRSPAWLDAEKNPKIVFEGQKVKKLEGDKYEVTGSFTLHGVKKDKTITVETKKIPAEVAQKMMMDNADWIRVRAEFTIKLSDYGVKIPEMAAAKVNDEWTIKVSAFAKGAIK